MSRRFGTPVASTTLAAMMINSVVVMPNMLSWSSGKVWFALIAIPQEPCPFHWGLGRSTIFLLISLKLGSYIRSRI